MTELLQFAFAGVSIVPTLLLLFTLIYWIIVILGVIDVDSLDIDLDLDMDLDADIEIGGLATVLSFFNIGHMPLMIFVTFFSLPFWMLTLLTLDFLHIDSVLLGLLVLFPAAFVCLFIAKFLTIPIAKFYRKVRMETEAIKHIVGQLCVAKLPIGDRKTSQAEIKVNGTSVLINVRTRGGQQVAKGQQALVIELNEEDQIYFVEPYQ